MRRFLIKFGIALILIAIVALSFLLNAAVVYTFGILPFLIAIAVLELAILIVFTIRLARRLWK